MNECSVSVQYLINLHPLKVSWMVPIFSTPLRASSSFRQRSPLCSVHRVALFSLSHSQMGLSPLNVLFKRLWGQEQCVFISEFSLLLFRVWVFWGSASDDKSQSLCLSLYSFSVISKLGQRNSSQYLSSEDIDYWRRPWSQERGVWSVPSSAIHMNYLTSLGLLEALSIKFLPPTVGSGLDKTQPSPFMA